MILKIVFLILITTNVVISQDDDKDEDDDYDEAIEYDELTFDDLTKRALKQVAGQYNRRLPSSCGLNPLNNGTNAEDYNFQGNNNIREFPWLGLLYYPNYQDTKRFTTPVVLVTKQFAIGLAAEVDQIPKQFFRARAKIILGDVCTKEGAPIKDYTFHSDYDKYKHALAVIQLENGPHIHSFRPACVPPLVLRTTDLYAITISKGCRKGYVTIYKVDQHVFCDITRRSAELSRSWPASATCAKPSLRTNSEQCTWVPGVPLMGYQEGRWRLFGFGTLGLGCDEPSRFLDYGIYSKWIGRSSKMVGLPTITRMGKNTIIMRRVPSHIRRYGQCDPEEVKHEIYTDQVHLVMNPPLQLRSLTYNVSLYQNREYACMVFKLYHNRLIKDLYKNDSLQAIRPEVDLKQFTVKETNTSFCRTFGVKQFDFEVSLAFSNEAYFELYVYGRELRIFNFTETMTKRNNITRVPKPLIPSYKKIRQILHGKFQ